MWQSSSIGRHWCWALLINSITIELIPWHVLRVSVSMPKPDHIFVLTPWHVMRFLEDASSSVPKPSHVSRQWATVANTVFNSAIIISNMLGGFKRAAVSIASLGEHCHHQQHRPSHSHYIVAVRNQHHHLATAWTDTASATTW